MAVLASSVPPAPPPRGGRRYQRASTDKKVPLPGERSATPGVPSRPGSGAGPRRSRVRKATDASDEELEYEVAFVRCLTEGAKQDALKAVSQRNSLRLPGMRPSSRQSVDPPSRAATPDSRPARPPSVPSRPQSRCSSRGSRRSTERTFSMQSVNSIVDDEQIPKLAHQITFANCSIDDVDELILAEEPGTNWFKSFWHIVLVQQPLCRALSSRSLVNWVAIYNRWQATTDWKGSPPAFMNSYELQEWVAAPLTRVMELVKLFDPPGYAKFDMTKSAAEHLKMRVPVVPLMAACMLMSVTVSNRQKLRFLFGLFDLEDKDALTEEQFTDTLSSLFQGLGFSFSMRREVPTQRQVTLAAKKVFARLLRLAPPSAAEAGRVPMAVLSNWFAGNTFDPIAVPFALFLERFSVPDYAVDPDIYNDENKQFRLSHARPVESPLECITQLESGFLTRAEVVMTRDLFEYCRGTGCFSLSHSDAEMAVGRRIDVQVWCGRYARALEEADAVRGTGVRFDFNTFLKKLCPKAGIAHLRMYHSWLKEFDSLQAEKSTLERSQQMLALLQQYSSLPAITERIKHELKSSFGSIDRAHQGKVTTADLQAAMEVATNTAQSMMQYFDINGDGSVDLEEYVAAMCPPTHRLPSKIKDTLSW
ncbi:unnamed protein product [Effrenium voratum]|uniref:EF-hand domain-containing protein n=1 Tax=Effrenium voratum TaxID=2562239 RepID=A0AA36HYD6_9DINO|nr:unnamed protein product [Effrenium voratum]